MGPLRHVWRYLGGLRALAADEGGNVAITFGLSILPLLTMVGVAVDGLLAYSVQAQLQKSLDAAGLAAGRALDEEDVEPDARAYFYGNFDAGPDVATVTSFSAVTEDDGARLVLTASATMPTHFMLLFGFDDLAIDARTVINREVRQMELALVLDNTGSMWGTPFDTMKAAALELVDIIYGADETHANLWVAVVPYAATVNIGNARTSWLDSADRVRTGGNTAYAPSTWKGCVMGRASPDDEADLTPGAAPLRSYLYPDASDNDWGAPRNPPTDERLAARNDGYGPNLGCGQPILSLTAEKTRVKTALNGMGAWHRGGTFGNMGLVWGWNVISPRWRGLWGGNTPATLPLDYDAALSDKVVVFLTDGNNEVYDYAPAGPDGSDHTSYGRLWEFMPVNSTLSQGKTLMDGKMSRICTSMKTNGIIIYTITFGATPEQRDEGAVPRLRQPAGVLFARPGQRHLAHDLPPGRAPALQPAHLAVSADGRAPPRPVARSRRCRRRRVRAGTAAAAPVPAGRVRARHLLRDQRHARGRHSRSLPLRHHRARGRGRAEPRRGDPRHHRRPQLRPRRHGPHRHHDQRVSELRLDAAARALHRQQRERAMGRGRGLHRHQWQRRLGSRPGPGRCGWGRGHRALLRRVRDQHLQRHAGPHRRPDRAPGECRRAQRAFLTMRAWRNLWRDERGLGALEFAFVLPMLLILVGGTFELSRYILLSTKLQHAATTMGDIATREEILTAATLDDIFSAVQQICQPFDIASSGRVIVTSLAVSGGAAAVQWRRGGAGSLDAASRVATAADLPADIVAGDPETVVVTEVFFAYQPWLMSMIPGTTLRRVAYYRPRFGALATLG